jgi:hypothetical protein
LIYNFKEHLIKSAKSHDFAQRGKTGDKVKDAIQKKLDDIEKYFNTKEWADRVTEF